MAALLQYLRSAEHLLLGGAENVKLGARFPGVYSSLPCRSVVGHSSAANPCATLNFALVDNVS